MIESLVTNSASEVNKISAIVPTHYHPLVSDPTQLVIHAAHFLTGSQDEIYTCPRPLHTSEAVLPVKFRFIINDTIRQSGAKQAVWVQIDSA